MGNIRVLSSETINRIAAGEVIERPASIVKELVENSIDSGATSITVEIKNGGISFIRVTDNGSGFEKDDIPTAFLRHATSKIREDSDLLRIMSLGFRGEALSSIASVSKVELLTKKNTVFLGTRYVIEGGQELAMEDAGCPDGTSFFIRDLFYNVPARRKFLKSAVTEAGYINELVNRLAVSHCDIAFSLIIQGRTILHTSGNGKLKDCIYSVFGKEIADNLIAVDYQGELYSVSGFLGKSVINRGNRNYEMFFVNGRSIRSNLLYRSVEEAYASYLMQHKYPFTVLLFTMNPESIDVNIHPTKMDVRFSNQEELSESIRTVLAETLKQSVLIPKVKLVEEREEHIIPKQPEYFEQNRIQANANNQPKAEQLSFFETVKPAIKETDTSESNESGFKKDSETYGAKKTSDSYEKAYEINCNAQDFSSNPLTVNNNASDFGAEIPKPISGSDYPEGSSVQTNLKTARSEVHPQQRHRHHDGFARDEQLEPGGGRGHDQDGRGERRHALREERRQPSRLAVVAAQLAHLHGERRRVHGRRGLQPHDALPARLRQGQFDRAPASARERGAALHGERRHAHGGHDQDGLLLRSRLELRDVAFPERRQRLWPGLAG